MESRSMVDELVSVKVGTVCTGNWQSTRFQSTCRLLNTKADFDQYPSGLASARCFKCTGQRELKMKRR